MMAPSPAAMNSSAFVSLEAERRILGALMRQPKLLYRIGDLTAADFSTEEHAELFETIRVRIREGEPADAVNTWIDSGQRGELRALIDLEDASVLDATPSYAGIVRRQSQRRALLDALDVARRGLLDDPRADPERVIAEAMATLDGALHRSAEDMTLEQALDAADALEAEREARRKAGTALGVSTTLPTLDATLARLYGPRLYVLGARPGSYKSTLAWQIVVQAGLDDIPAGMISLEMGGAELGQRTYRARGRDVRRNLPVYLDTRSHTLDQISGRIVEWVQARQVRLVVVDHLQLIATPGRSRHEEMSEISRRLKLLAVQHDVPILALSQLSRSVESERREPRLSDLKESGSLEQDADGVLFIHGTQSPNGTGPAGDTFELLVAKNRDGAARIRPIALQCDGAQMTVREERPW